MSDNGRKSLGDIAHGSYRSAAIAAVDGERGLADIGLRILRTVLRASPVPHGGDMLPATSTLNEKMLRAMELRVAGEFAAATELLHCVIDGFDSVLTAGGSDVSAPDASSPAHDEQESYGYVLRLQRAKAWLELAVVYLDQAEHSSATEPGAGPAPQAAPAAEDLRRAAGDIARCQLAALAGKVAVSSEAAVALHGLAAECHRVIAVSLEFHDVVTALTEFEAALDRAVAAEIPGLCIEIAWRSGRLLADIGRVNEALDQLIPAMLAADAMRYEVSGAGQRHAATTDRDRIRIDILELLTDVELVPDPSRYARVIAEIVEVACDPGAHRVLVDGDALRALRRISDDATLLDIAPPPRLALPWGVALDRYYEIARRWIAATSLRGDIVAAVP